jgi:hypothetical protein
VLRLQVPPTDDVKQAQVAVLVLSPDKDAPRVVAYVRACRVPAHKETRRLTLRHLNLRAGAAAYSVRSARRSEPRDQGASAMTGVFCVPHTMLRDWWPLCASHRDA